MNGKSAKRQKFAEITAGAAGHDAGIKQRTEVSAFSVTYRTRMWADAQRDGRPAEVAPSAQRRKVWLTPTTRVVFR